MDVRDKIHFDIFRHSKKGYSAVRKSKGWLKSQVFGKPFQLIQVMDTLGNPAFSLRTK